MSALPLTLRPSPQWNNRGISVPRWYSSRVNIPLRSRFSGFTLLELSIVIVVIALLLGGIFVGRDLIYVSEIRRQVAQIQEIDSNVLAFKSKFGCLPGDCINASDFFGTGTQNGNGNSRITGYAEGAPWDDNPNPPTIVGSWVAFGGNDGMGNLAEWSFAFDHLSAAGLADITRFNDTWTDATRNNIPGVGYPNMKFISKGKGPLHDVNWNEGPGGVVIGWETRGTVTYQTFPHVIPSGHKIRLGAARCNPGAWPTFALCFQASLDPWDAYAIDSKIDDGYPLQGNIVTTIASAYTYSTDPYTYCVVASGSRVVYRSPSNQVSWGGRPIGRYCAIEFLASF